MNENNKKNMARFRGISGLIMGLLYGLIGAAILYMQANNKFEEGSFFGLGATASYIIGAVFIAYGVFRIYRGVQWFKAAN